MRDFRVWWALFVFFAVLCVLALQRGYRRWRRLLPLVAAVPGPQRAVQERRLRREGWRLASMAASLLAMTALVFAALLGAPPALVLALRAAAVGGVLGVIGLGLRR
jgi:hypothetical protein